MSAPLTVLVFGATGTAGGSVLRACLDSSEVGEVRAIVRRPLALAHAKLRVTLHDDYLDHTKVRAAFRGVDACYFCLGISVYQVPDEAAYRRITQQFPVAAARVLREESPAAQFHYLSGGRASLTSGAMWARVKAEAERDLIAAVNATCWRPAFIDGEASANAPRIYQWIRPVFRVFRGVRGFYVSGEDIGRAMIGATRQPMPGRIIENPELRDIADAYSKTH